MTLRNFLHFRSGSQTLGMRVERSLSERAFFHWKILVCIFLIMTLFVFVTSFVVYQDIGRGEFSSVTTSPTPHSGPVTLERLKKIISRFETKSVTFEQIRRNREVSPDPSR